VAILRSCLERIPLILKRKRHSSLTPRLGNSLASRRLKPFRFYQSVRSDGLSSVENLACIDTHLAIQFGSGRSRAALFSAGNRGHTPAEWAVDYAVAARAKRLALTHHDPLRDDEAVDRVVEMCRRRASAAGSGLEVFAAAEG
jgi:hypothetical protein